MTLLFFLISFSTCRLVLSLFWISRDMLGVDILMCIVVD